MAERRSRMRAFLKGFQAFTLALTKDESLKVRDVPAQLTPVQLPPHQQPRDPNARAKVHTWGPVDCVLMNSGQNLVIFVPRIPLRVEIDLVHSQVQVDGSCWVDVLFGGERRGIKSASYTHVENEEPVEGSEFEGSLEFFPTAVVIRSNGMIVGVDWKESHVVLQEIAGKLKPAGLNGGNVYIVIGPKVRFDAVFPAASREDRSARQLLEVETDKGG